MKNLENVIKSGCKSLPKSEPVALVEEDSGSFNDEIKELSKENEKLKAKLANEAVGDVLSQRS
ncbi:MAG: hypothetical protein ACLRR3_02280 [Eubacterium sp.]